MVKCDLKSHKQEREICKLILFKGYSLLSSQNALFTVLSRWTEHWKKRHFSDFWENTTHARLLSPVHRISRTSSLMILWPITILAYNRRCHYTFHGRAAHARLFCATELWGAFKSETPKAGASENEMLRSLTFILQLGCGFMWECQGIITDCLQHCWKGWDQNNKRNTGRKLGECRWD
jgi:hypothetical protein